MRTTTKVCVLDDHGIRAKNADEFAAFVRRVKRVDIADTTHLTMGEVTATVSTIYGHLFQVAVHDGAGLIGLDRRKTRTGALDHAYSVMFTHVSRRRVVGKPVEQRRPKEPSAISEWREAVRDAKAMRNEVLRYETQKAGRKRTDPVDAFITRQAMHELLKEEFARIKAKHGEIPGVSSVPW